MQIAMQVPVVPVKADVTGWHLPKAYLTEKKQLIQLLVQSTGGLVDGGHNSSASLGQLPQQLQQVHSCSTIQPLRNAVISKMLPKLTALTV